MKTTLQTIATVFFIGVFASAQVKLDSGLAAYYPFDNDTKDYSGNNRHSLSNNAAFVTGRSTAAEKAISYDGSTFSVLPISFTITSATISF